MKRWSRWFGPLCALCIAVATPFAVANWTSQALSSARWMVRDVSVTGLETMGEAEVLVAAALDRPRHVFSLRAEGIQEAVESLPMVRRASASIGFDGHVRIEVEERIPAGVVLAEGATLVDVYGEAVRPFDRVRDSRLPLVLSSNGRASWNPSRVARGLELARVWSDGSRSNAVEVHDEGHHGWRLVCADGVEVRVANDAWALRLTRIDDALSRASATGRRVSYVHADGAVDQVVLGWEERGE